ncbi:MAG: heavy metal translocating P-type ATPase, partial [Mitsuokella sp.]
MNKKQRKNLIRIVLTVLLLALIGMSPLVGMAKLAAYFAACILIGGDILRKAGIGILHREPLDENLLMSLASLGAFALAAMGTEDFFEAVAILLFYQIGVLFEGYAVGKSRRDIGALMDIRPDYANIWQDGKLVRVDPDAVGVGTEIVVQPGERVPIDGIVMEGESTLSTSALTGESLPQEIGEGQEALSGCINLTRVLRIRTTKPFEESTASKILELVEEASSRKSRAEVFITRFARIYTPAVVSGAVLLAVALPIMRLAFGMAAEWEDW